MRIDRKKTLITAGGIAAAVLFAPAAFADSAAQYAGRWGSHTEVLDIYADGTAVETVGRTGEKITFNFRDIATVNGIPGGAGIVTSGPNAGAQAGFNVVKGSGGDAIALTWTGGDQGWVFCREGSAQARQFCG